MDHLETKVSAHRSRDFRMIDFVDTPGLVDGNVEYPFDVNGVLQLLAGVADLVLVFVDPMGQALCSRTMQAVHALERRNASKMRYFLSKVDTIGDLNDLLKVSNQMTQNLSKYVHNTHGFHVDPVFIPGAADDVDPAIARVNRIEALCDELGRAVHQKVQNNMALAAEHVDAVLRAAQLHVSRGQRRDSVRAYLGIFRVLLLALLLSPLALLSAHHLLPLVFDDDPNVALVTGAIDTALGFGAALVVHPLAPGVDGARRGLIAWVILALLYVVRALARPALPWGPLSQTRPTRPEHRLPTRSRPFSAPSQDARLRTCLPCVTGPTTSTASGMVRRVAAPHLSFIITFTSWPPQSSTSASSLTPCTSAKANRAAKNSVRT